MKTKSILALSLALVLSLSVMAGCTKKPSDEGTSSTPPSSTEPEKIATGMLKTVHEGVKTAFGENYIPSQPLDAAMVEEQFGIQPDMVKEIIAEGPMMSTHSDMFIGIEAVDEAKAKEIVTLLETYKKDQLAGHQYPMNQIKINATEIVRYDNYVFFMPLGNVDAPEDATEEDTLKMVKDEVQKGYDAVKEALKIK